MDASLHCAGARQIKRRPQRVGRQKTELHGDLLLPNDRPDRAKWTSADWTRGDGKEDRIGDTGGDQDACDHNGQGLELTHSVSSFTLKSRWHLVFVAAPGPGQQFSGKQLSGQNSSIVASRYLRLHFSPIEKLPSCAWSLRSGVSSMDDCLNVGATGG
jgi:hypothetical protein